MDKGEGNMIRRYAFNTSAGVRGTIRAKSHDDACNRISGITIGEPITPYEDSDLKQYPAITIHKDPIVEPG